MSNKISKIITTSSLSAVITACTTQGAVYNPHKNQEEVYNPHTNSSYIVRGHNRTFAVYNNENRLISHPIEELLAEMKWRELADKPPITDIYVVSHGWNYTLPVAIANYHTYIEMVDNFYNKKEYRDQIDSACEALQKAEKIREKGSTDQFLESTATKCFQPYFIFITWTSTVRPFTDAANGILPFGMDDAVRPITSFIDKVPGHLVTAWKQSMNAGQNALGTRYPNYYLNQDWKTTSYGYRDRFLFEDSDSAMGEDVPVSAVLYKLIQMKKPANSQPECDKPDIISSDSDHCVSLANTKIHLAGHSYGAKLVALAGMEAIRRWMLNELIHGQYSTLLASTVQNNSTKNSAVKNKPDLKELLQDFNNPLWEGTGHHLTTESEIFSLWKKEKKPEYLRQLYNLSNRFFPIDSLTLFNPAFLPGELSYSVDTVLKAPLGLQAPVDTLRFIPRKAIVYTNSDSANGTLFSARDILINTEFSQQAQSFINNFSALADDHLRQSNLLARAVVYPLLNIAQGVTGAYELGEGIVFGFLNFGFNTITDLPMDFWHHIHNYGNPLDFFIPSFKEEKMQGLYRLSRPGLGKTGLNNLAEGRWVEKKLSGLAPYYTEFQAFGEDEDKSVNNGSDKSVNDRDNKEPPFAPNIDAARFCKFAGTNRFFDHDSTQLSDLSGLREKFFSFDASQVYDSWDPLVGAHSDLRETEPPKDSCKNPSLKNRELLQKREYTFNFLLNFTKTNFEQTLSSLQLAHDSKMR